MKPRNTNPWLVLVLVAFGEFMVVLDATIVNVALPSIRADLGFSATDLQWVVNGYALLFGGFLLLGGRAGDLFGRRRVFVAGVTVFTVASVANAVAQSPEVLIAGRALQGLGAAMISPAALSIITSTFPAGAQRTKALSVWAGIAVGGGGAGLLLGGLLTETLSWEWIFLINVPVGIVAAALTLALVPESRLAARRGFDVLGAVTVTAGLLALVYAIVKAPDWGFGDERTLVLTATAALLIGAFLMVEARRADPLIRLGIFRIRPLATANGAAVLVSAALFPVFFFTTLYMQEIKAFSPIESGAGFLPFTLSVLVGAGLAQGSLPRFGPKPVSLFGLTLAAAGFAMLSQLEPRSEYLTHLAPALVLTGFGIGNVWLPMTMAATGKVDGDRQGLASGLVNTSQQIGGALGLAVLSTVASEHARSVLADGGDRSAAAATAATLDGFTLAYLIGAGLMVLALVLVAARMDRDDVEIASAEPAAAGTAG